MTNNENIQNKEMGESLYGTAKSLCPGIAVLKSCGGLSAGSY